MTTAALLAFVHHTAAFVIFAALAVELVLLKSELSLSTTRSLLRMDAAYGIAAGLLLIVGFLRVFYTEKGDAYYFRSIPFIVKISAFAIVGILSIYPTVKFLSWRKVLNERQVPQLSDGERRKLRTIIHAELALIVVILLCAALMARGIGFLG